MGHLGTNRRALPLPRRVMREVSQRFRQASRDKRKRLSAQRFAAVASFLQLVPHRPIYAQLLGDLIEPLKMAVSAPVMSERSSRGRSTVRARDFATVDGDARIRCCCCIFASVGTWRLPELLARYTVISQAFLKVFISLSSRLYASKRLKIGPLK